MRARVVYPCGDGRVETLAAAQAWGPRGCAACRVTALVPACGDRRAGGAACGAVSPGVAAGGSGDPGHRAGPVPGLGPRCLAGSARRNPAPWTSRRLAARWGSGRAGELEVHQVIGGGPMPAYIRLLDRPSCWQRCWTGRARQPAVGGRGGGSSTGKSRAAYEAVTAGAGGLAAGLPAGPWCAQRAAGGRGPAAHGVVAG